MLLEILNIIVPVFVTIAVGYVWAKSGRPFDSGFVTTLVTDIGTPCLVFGTLSKLEISASAVGNVMVASALALVGFAVLGTALIKLTKQSVNTFLPSLMFPNAGNLGLPMSLMAFGKPGLSYAIAIYAIIIAANYTVGQALAAGSADLKKFLRMPLPYAVALGIVCTAFHYQPPKAIVDTCTLLGGMTIPLMAIMLGVSLAKLKVSTLGKGFAFSIARFAIGLAVGFAVARGMGLDKVSTAVLVLQCAMPVAVFNYLFAERYGRSPEVVASMVVVSTALSFATIPLLLMYLVR